MANAKLSTKSTQRGSVALMNKENTNPSRRNVATKTSENETKEINIGNKQEAAESDVVAERPSLLGAILNKKAVSLSVPSQEHDLCGDDCNCADPILEIDDDDDENNSAFDASSVNYDVEDSDDESIQLVSARKTSRKKAFILESDDDDDEEDDVEMDKSLVVSPQKIDSDGAKKSRESTTVIDELSDFNPSSEDDSEDSSISSSDRSAPVVTRRNPTRRTKAALSFSVNSDVISDSDEESALDDDDKSSSSEEEWDGDMSPD